MKMLAALFEYAKTFFARKAFAKRSSEYVMTMFLFYSGWLGFFASVFCPDNQAVILKQGWLGGLYLVAVAVSLGYAFLIANAARKVLEDRLRDGE